MKVVVDKPVESDCCIVPSMHLVRFSDVVCFVTDNFTGKKGLSNNETAVLMKLQRDRRVVPDTLNFIEVKQFILLSKN